MGLEAANPMVVAQCLAMAGCSQSWAVATGDVGITWVRQSPREGDWGGCLEACFGGIGRGGALGVERGRYYELVGGVAVGIACGLMRCSCYQGSHCIRC